MGIPRFALSLGICASFATSTALAQSEGATTVSAPAPPINDPTPAPAVVAERDRPRVRFDATAGLAWFFNRGFFTAGPAIALGVGVQINDRWAVTFRAIAHSIVVFGGNHAQLLAEWSPIPSAISLGFGAGVIHSYMLVTSPCAGCPPPVDLSITAPIELAAYAHMRRANQVERRGFRLALQAAPTLSVYNSAAYDTALKVGITVTLQAGWALR